MTKKIGFVGLGNMGSPIAQRLLEAGYSLMVYDLRSDISGDWQHGNCCWAESLSEIANNCEYIFLSLPTPDVVKAVILGAGGLVSGQDSLKIIDLSTTGPEVSKEIAATLSNTNKVFIDAPVSGGVSGAKAGTLALMIACSRHDFEEASPLFEAIGKLFHVGNDPGMGQTMKVLNNLLSSAALALSAELVVTGVKAGLDASTMIDVLNVSSGRNSATVEKFPNAILTRNFDFGFTHKLVNKDASLCLNLAKQQGLTLPIASAVLDTWKRAIEEIGPEEDFTTVVKLYEKEAGIEVRGKKVQK